MCDTYNFNLFYTNIDTMELKFHFTYLAPEFEVVEIEVERGFALSNLENPEEKPEQDW